MKGYLLPATNGSNFPLFFIDLSFNSTHMNPIQELDNPPTDPRPPRQPFDLLLARYKAHMYESYATEIGRMENAGEWGRLLLTDDKKQRNHG
jgi:hypothetical protein